MTDKTTTVSFRIHIDEIHDPWLVWGRRVVSTFTFMFGPIIVGHYIGSTFFQAAGMAIGLVVAAVFILTETSNNHAKDFAEARRMLDELEQECARQGLLNRR